MPENEIRVLLIEDNPGDAKLVSMMLSQAKGASFHLETRDRLDTGLERLAQGGLDALLLDLSLPDSHGFETFDRAHAAAPSLPVVLLSSLDDETIALRAVELGAQDYLIKGRVDDHSLGRSLRFAVQRQKKQTAHLHKDQDAEGAKFLVLVGAKGGVGTTTLALNLAACIAWAKRSVIAVELRSSYGSFSHQLAHMPDVNLSSLLALETGRIDETEIAARLVKFPSGLRVLFGPQTIKESREIDLAKADALLNALGRMADFVIVDLPGALPAASQAAIRHAHFGGLVVDNEPSSIASGRAALEQLCSAGVSRSTLKAIIVNRSAPETGLRVGDISSQLDCKVFGVVTPAADLCVRSYKGGTPFVLSEPSHLASVAIYEMVYKLLSQDPVKAVA
ncbi:MAG TPA: response regulator [Terriglobia bacterium]|jgi:MinD-like ATPase involved in chromosome partitioning or flagellar assembly/FixJ family two-component response regulator|nr:response regulator [Terriglobia bacterium]